MQNVPYHAKIKLVKWEENLDRFRGHSVNGENENDSAVSVLFPTDLASRAWMPLVALPLFSYSLLGMWLLICIVCCGRAGNRNGRGIVFYGEKERELVEVVRDAEFQQERMMLAGDVGEGEDEIESEVAVPNGSMKNALAENGDSPISERSCGENPMLNKSCNTQALCSSFS